MNTINLGTTILQLFLGPIKDVDCVLYTFACIAQGLLPWPTIGDRPLKFIEQNNMWVRKVNCVTPNFLPVAIREDVSCGEA